MVYDVLDLACGSGRYAINLAERGFRVRVRWMLVRESSVKRFSFSLPLYSGHEMKNALKSAGFSDVQIYGDLDGNPYGIEANRLLRSQPARPSN